MVSPLCSKADAQGEHFAPVSFDRQTRERLASAYDEARAPFTVAVAGRSNLVVMSTSDLEAYGMGTCDADVRVVDEGSAMARSGNV